MEIIRKEYEKAVQKKTGLAAELREAEKAEPDNFHRIWQLRDRLAYWEGKAEAFEFCLKELGQG
jgi:hypothetical protein